MHPPEYYNHHPHPSPHHLPPGPAVPLPPNGAPQGSPPGNNPLPQGLAPQSVASASYNNATQQPPTYNLYAATPAMPTGPMKKAPSSVPSYPQPPYQQQPYPQQQPQQQHSSMPPQPRIPFPHTPGGPPSAPAAGPPTQTTSSQHMPPSGTSPPASYQQHPPYSAAHPPYGAAQAAQPPAGAAFGLLNSAAPPALLSGPPVVASGPGHVAASGGTAPPPMMYYGAHSGGPPISAGAPPHQTKDQPSFGTPATTAASAYPYLAATAAGAQSHSDPNAEARAQEAQVNNPYPHYAQATTLRLPNSASLNQKARIPLAVVFRPLAPTPEGLSEIPSVSFGTSGKVVRCTRCRTYMNPFVEWDANGRRWICNLCSYGNDTPQQYYCGLDETGRRMDRLDRPELSRSSVEFIAPDDYMIRPPQPPTFMFLIDVSAGAVASGMVDAVCLGIKSVIQSGLLPGGSRTQVGIATYDNTVHFYNLDPNLSQAQMLVMPDLMDCFLPIAEGMLVLACEAQQTIENLLDNLPSMWRSQRIVESCMGSAIKAAYITMKHIGGKLFVFTSAPPSVGECTLTPNREPSKASSDGSTMTSAKREAEVLQPATKDYAELGGFMTQAQISVDVFACLQGNQQIDLATLAPLATRSGGDIHYYPSFNAHLQGEKLREEIYHSLTREQGWEGLVRFRVSKGWSISTWYGHFLLRRPDLLVLPCAHADQTFTVVISMQENVVPDPLVFLQGALLYTNSEGERRIRVHTYCLAVTQNLSDMVSTMSVPVTTYVIGQHALQLAATSGLAAARTHVQTVCGQIVQSIQGDRPGANSAAHDAAAKLLPLYILGLLKSPILREARDTPNDVRVFHWHRMMALPVDSAIALFYPRMIPLTDLQQSHGTPDESMQISLPESIGLSASNMLEGGAYLLEDGESLLLWISRSISSHWLRAVFGVDSIDQLQPDYSETLIGCSGDPYGSRVAAIIRSMQMERKPPFMKLTVIRQGDLNEYKFFGSVIEDRNHAMMMSYAEFMQKIVPRSGLGQPTITRAGPPYS